MQFGIHSLLFRETFIEKDLPLLDKCKGMGFDAVEVLPFDPDNFPGAKVKAAAADLTVADLRLFESLKAWRLAHAEADAKPAFTVLVDASLAEIASKRPSTLGQLSTVKGVGPSKLDRYGIEILEIVAADPARP